MSQEPVYFIIPGACVPKGRPRVTFKHGTAIAYTPKKTRDYSTKAGWIAKKVYLEKGLPPIERGKPVKMTVEFMLTGTPPKRPDMLNLLMQIGDTLQKICYVDDSQIVELHAYKVKGAFSMTSVIVEELGSGDSVGKPDTKKHNAASKNSGGKGDK